MASCMPKSPRSNTALYSPFTSASSPPPSQRLSCSCLSRWLLTFFLGCTDLGIQPFNHLLIRVLALPGYTRPFSAWLKGASTNALGVTGEIPLSVRALLNERGLPPAVRLLLPTTHGPSPPTALPAPSAVEEKHSNAGNPWCPLQAVCCCSV